MSKTQRWDWAIGLKLEELNERHLHQAYKLNWDNLCKFDSCRKNCKRILCLACFDKSWIDNDSANNSGYDNYDTTNCEQKRTNLKTFVGLKNLGATCYVNCLLQLWFHNPALRKAIYEWDKDGDSEIQDVNGNQKSSQSKEVCLVVNNDERLQKTTPKRLCDEEKLISSPNKKISRETNPIEQLQLIFARLQFTNKKSIDPYNFIDSLALNAAEQQDAQEFGNLFMEFLEKSFANQSNSFVNNIIQNQFCGRYSYATICDYCKHRSLSDSNFYELDLSIQNLETLHDCLNEYFRPVPLDGKYNCSQCQKAQSAHRKIILKSLPPTLNLQLLRFVYDVQRNVRQKLNSHIIFPEVLDMSPFISKSKMNSLGTNGKYTSNIYLLSAVLIHRGSSPHSGHYIAHIKDRISKDWYKFNDDSVERIGPQLQVSTDGENISIVDDKSETIKIADPKTGKVTRYESKSLKSKTAYMLVYQAKENEALTYPSDHSEKWILPDHLQTSVLEENSRSEELFESLQIAKEMDQQIIDARKNQIRSIYDKLVCRDPNDKFEFIDKGWIQRWLTESSSTAKFQPIDNSNLMCIHDKLDFRKLDQAKCIKSEGADLLYKEFGGGPRLQDAMCKQCVELEVRLIQLKDRLKEDQKFITSQAKFKLDADYDFADAFIVGKNSYRDWQALVMVQFEKSYPELSKRGRDNGNAPSSDDEEHKSEKASRDNHESSKIVAKNEDSNSDSDDEAMEKFVFNSDILCEHNQLIHDTSAWRIVPKEVWAVFKNYFSNDASRPLIERNANTLMCPECKKQEVEQQEIGDVQKLKATEQKSRLPDLFHNRKRAGWCSMLPGDEYYALDRQFLSKWQKWLRNPCNQEQPEAIINRDRLVCEHGKSLYNNVNSNPVLQECPFILISPEELKNLKLYYPIDHEIRFTVDENLAEEKMKLYTASLKVHSSKKSITNIENLAQPDNSGDNYSRISQFQIELKPLNDQILLAQSDNIQQPVPQVNEEVDLTEIDWSECVVSYPGFCSDCHDILKQDELKKLLNYESTTIYITKVENPGSIVYGPQNNPSLANQNGSGTGPSTTALGDHNENCDTEANQAQQTGKSNEHMMVDEVELAHLEDSHPYKKRKKCSHEDEANDFVPPGGTKHQSPTPVTPNTNSILRRTTRRNRNREQAYIIKPTQTLLQLKKEIFARCQVLPVDQRLFLNDVLLDDNSKTMSELRIVPECSLKLEVDRPLGDNIDMIEDESMSRKSCTQPETGFKGSLLLSNSHL